MAFLTSRRHFDAGPGSTERGRTQVRQVGAGPCPLWCSAIASPLIVAKVDRLARSKGFLERILESGVDVRFCDLPKIEGQTGRFILQQMTAMAELESGLISARTKD